VTLITRPTKPPGAVTISPESQLEYRDRGSLVATSDQHYATTERCLEAFVALYNLITPLAFDFGFQVLPTALVIPGSRHHATALLERELFGTDG